MTGEGDTVIFASWLDAGHVTASVGNTRHFLSQLQSWIVLHDHCRGNDEWESVFVHTEGNASLVRLSACLFDC